MKTEAQKAAVSEQIQAGRELDALVAEKVLGCKVYTFKRHDGAVIRYRCDCAKGTPEPPPHSDDFIDHTVKPYSADMRAAWEIIEHMSATTKEYWRFEYFSTGALAEFDYEGGRDKPWAIGEHRAEAETMSLAICRAALLAVA